MMRAKLTQSPEPVQPQQYKQTSDSHLALLEVPLTVTYPTIVRTWLLQHRVVGRVGEVVNSDGARRQVINTDGQALELQAAGA